MTVLIKTETHYLLLGKTEKYEDMSQHRYQSDTRHVHLICRIFNVNTVEIIQC